MPDTATVRVRTSDGHIWDIPRENLPLAKIKFGAVEMPPEKKETPFSVEIGKEVTRGMGFDPEKAERMELDLAGHRHPLRGALELANQFMKGGSKWMESVAKDPFKIAEPVESVATGVEKGMEGVWKSLTEDDDPSMRKVALALARLTGASSMALAGSEKGETFRAPVRAALELPKKVGEVPKAVSREVLGVTAKDIEKARKPVEERATTARTQAKNKYGESVTAADRAKIAQSRLEGQRTSFERLKDRLAEQTTENLDKAERAEKASLDTRYGDFRRQFLGVSEAHPNGLVQSNLSAVAEAVLDAKKNILKGSSTSVPIFNDILGRIKDMVETPEGDLKPVAGEMIPTDQLRGYVTELNDRIYDAELPHDVRNALKSVVAKADAEVLRSIQDTSGPQVAGLYGKLKADYTDYMETWRDRSSGSPLPAIQRILHQPMTTKRGIPVYREIGKILEGKKGEKALAVIARKRGFGADPNLAARFRWAGEHLEGLPKSAGKIPKVERPDLGDIEHFDAEKFVRETAEGRAKSISRWGTAGAIAWMIRDILHGNIPSAPLVAAPVVQHFLMRAMTSPKFLKWIMEGVQVQ